MDKVFRTQIKKGRQKEIKGRSTILKRIIDMEIVANQTTQEAIEKHNR
jgi:hypothetical protein